MLCAVDVASNWPNRSQQVKHNGSFDCTRTFLGLNTDHVISILGDL